MNGEIATEEGEGFEEAGLHPYLALCYRSLRFERPTPIQFHAIRAYQSRGGSMVAQSKSGTGKTLSYISVLLCHLLAAPAPQPHCQYLIVVPTRELALQVYQNLREVAGSFEAVRGRSEEERAARAKLRQVRLLMSIGGIPFEDDRKKYLQSGGNIVVGTIGRTLEFIEKKLIKVGELRMLVLDEGDKIFECRNKRFGEVIAQAMALQEEGRYKVDFLLYSATYTRRLLEEITHRREFVFVQTLLGEEGLRVRVEEGAGAVGEGEEGREDINLENIKKYKLVASSEGTTFFSAKMAALTQLLQELSYLRCLVFVEKKTLLEQINERLIASHFEPLLIHGSLSQSSRIKLMNQINQSKIILASDLLARGIDIELDLVILFDAKNNDTFWHRIGRTGRYDKMGVAVSLDNVEGWGDYSREEVQGQLDRIQPTFNRGKEWYGKYLTEMGTWNETTAEKEIEQAQEYRYFEEERKERKERKQEPCLSQPLPSLAQLSLVKSESQLQALLSPLLKCGQCLSLLSSIQSLSGYCFQLRQYM